MRVIICGAGQVGSTIARHLASEGLDVTVIDISPEHARRVDESYDVRGMVGHAAHPDVLERAGARDADMLIAITRSDEIADASLAFATGAISSRSGAVSTLRTSSRST